MKLNLYYFLMDATRLHVCVSGAMISSTVARTRSCGHGGKYWEERSVPTWMVANEHDPSAAGSADRI